MKLTYCDKCAKRLLSKYYIVEDSRFNMAGNFKQTHTYDICHACLSELFDKYKSLEFTEEYEHIFNIRQKYSEGDN